MGQIGKPFSVGMKILYDHQIFSTQRFGGVSKYFYETIRNIPEEHSYKIAVLLSENQYLKEGYDIFKIRSVPFGDMAYKGKGFLMENITRLNQFYSDRCISADKFDVFHPTFYNDYFLKRLKKPYIITVHDMIRFKFQEIPGGEQVRMQMENTIKRANRIIAVSENTKKDVIDIMRIHPGKIDVVYHGFNRQTRIPSVNLYGEYILYVGRRDFYKNFIPFAEAISSLLFKEKKLKLICTGEPFTKNELKKLNELNILKQTVHIAANEKELNDLYSHAQLFVYPSVYEGFGMPILEAFANNCPVCLSNASCFPEIAGNAAVYFDPYNKESMLETIRKVLHNNRLRSNLITEGKQRLSEFSWNKTAEKTIDTYKKLL